MSLETSLELNNKLLTQQNTLLEQLLTALASGSAIQQTTAGSVQEYRETVPDKSTTDDERPDLETLEFSDVIALASFYPVPVMYSFEMFQRAIDYRDAVGEKRVVQIDALDMALRGVKRANHLSKPALLDLARHVIRFWDDLPTIESRRDFAERLLDAPAAGRDEVKPKKASGKDKQTEERQGPFYCKSVDGTAASELHTLRKLNAMLEKGHIEITRVEYLQLQEEFARNDAANGNNGEDTGGSTDSQPDFVALRKQAEGLILQLAKGGYRAEAVAILEKQGAQKLGGVADEDLKEVIAQAEKALEG
ncbi:hypothetical protein ACLBW2_12275 [Enterobacteriaceae bacterium C23F]